MDNLTDDQWESMRSMIPVARNQPSPDCVIYKCLVSVRRTGVAAGSSLHHHPTVRYILITIYFIYFLKHAMPMFGSVKSSAVSKRRCQSAIQQTYVCQEPPSPGFRTRGIRATLPQPVSLSWLCNAQRELSTLSVCKRTLQL